MRRKPPTWVRPGLAAYTVVHFATWCFLIDDDVVRREGFLAHVSIWDGQWFLQAASALPHQLPIVNGRVAQNPLAFFPLFPQLLRILSLGHHLPIEAVGLVVTTILGAAAVWAVARLAYEWRGEVAAERAGILLAISPGAFVFSLLYSEGLFITLSALALLAMMQQRWWRAGLLSVLASATAAIGLGLAVALLAIVIERRRERPWRAFAAMCIAPLGFLGYVAFVGWYTGQWNAWFLTERSGWHSYFSPLFPIETLARFFRNPSALTFTQHLLFWCTLLGVVLVIRALRSHLPTPVLWYTLAVTALAATSVPIGLRPRFLLCAVPLLFGLTTTTPRWWRGVVVVSILGLIAMTIEELLSFAVFP